VWLVSELLRRLLGCGASYVSGAVGLLGRARRGLRQVPRVCHAAGHSHPVGTELAIVHGGRQFDCERKAKFVGV